MTGKHLARLALAARNISRGLGAIIFETQRIRDELDRTVRSLRPLPRARGDGKCPQCQGHGTIGVGAIDHTCPTCGGSGTGPIPPDRVPCPYCEGSGLVGQLVCPKCGGTKIDPFDARDLEEALARDWEPGDDEYGPPECYHVKNADGSIYDVANNLGELAEVAAQCYTALPPGTYQVHCDGRPWGLLDITVHTWRVRGNGVDLAPGSIVM